MTTPRDDIDGLIERLRRMSPQLDILQCENVLQASDKLAALSARVKELEGELTNCRSDCAATSNSYLQRAIDAESRAARLQQERDEAYERAANVAGSRWRDWSSSYEKDGMGACLDIAAAIRRLAGPEKEGK